MRRRWLGLVAAATVVLIAVVGWRMVHHGARQDFKGDQTIANDNNSSNSQPRQANQDAPKPSPVVNNKSPKSGAWDDPLETQIASVSQQIRDVEQNWRRRADDLDLVQYRIDKASDSMQDDPL
jgi:hypothetical protein